MSQSVKFTCQRARADMPSFSALAELNACRRKLLELGVIGVDPKGIGFGNLSLRDGETNTFYITGSATSRLATLSLGDCVRVMESDFKRNWVRYEGTAIPSSESLTHAAIYMSDPPTSAVIHCHDSALWATLLDCASTTSKSIPYGTPQMAYEVNPAI
jgi:L-ribulose-5-phosphate 4-epimerase